MEAQKVPCGFVRKKIALWGTHSVCRRRPCSWHGPARPRPVLLTDRGRSFFVGALRCRTVRLFRNDACPPAGRTRSSDHEAGAGRTQMGLSAIQGASGAGRFGKDTTLGLILTKLNANAPSG